MKTNKINILKKLKQILTSRIFLFLLGGAIFGSLSAGAVTYFASNDVSYDNSESGLKSTNVQSAIDELYNECFPPTTADSIIKNVPIVTSGDGLYKDEYEEGRYIYKGANPNNYITFSGETWRIISLEKDGTIKILKKQLIGRDAWDESNSNNWTRPSTLNTYLNETYLPTLSEKSKIVSHNWGVGAITDNNNDLANQIVNENKENWNGKIGLITISEYLRANTNNSYCKTYSLNNQNASVCKTSNYIINNINPPFDILWTITKSENNNYNVFTIGNDGTINSYNSNGVYDFITIPAVYLSSNIILSGTGTETNPFIIKN